MNHSQWLERAQSLKPDGRMFIDGKLTPAVSGQTIPVISPRNGQEIAQLSRGKRQMSHWRLQQLNASSKKEAGQV